MSDQRRLCFKDGVTCVFAHPALLEALGHAVNVFWEIARVECIVTALQNGQHAPNSLHPFGMAADLRTHHVPEPLRQHVRQELAKRLGSDYDVIFEGSGTPEEHIHVECDSLKAVRYRYLANRLGVKVEPEADA